MQSVDYEGHWWVPGKFEDRVGGALSYEPQQGGDLNLFESFDSGLQPDPEHEYHSRLYGLSNEGDNLILVGCYRNGFGSTISQGSQVSYSSYQPSYIINGTLIPNNRNVTFSELKVSFPHLEEWSQHIPDSTIDSLKNGYRLELKNIDPLCATVTEYTVKLSTSITRSLSRTSTPKLGSNGLRAYVSSLRDLLTLATDQPLEPKYIQAKTPASTYIDTQIYYGDTTYGQSTTSTISNYNFKLSTIPDGFEGLMERWFKLRKDIRSTIDVFLGTRYSSRTYQQNQFLALTQAVEAYHRRRYSDDYIDPQRYDATIHTDMQEFIRGNISEIYDDPDMFKGNPLSVSQLQRLKSMKEAYNISNDFGNALDSAIEYANDYSLRTRFKELINNTYNHILRDLPHNPTEPGRIHSIIQTRNHFTHQKSDQQKDSAVAEGADLVRLSWSVEQLIEVALLSEIGVPDRQIRDTLQDRYSEYQVR